MKRSLLLSLALLSVGAVMLYVFDASPLLWWSYVSLVALVTLTNNAVWHWFDMHHSALKSATANPHIAFLQHEARDTGEDLQYAESVLKSTLQMVAVMFFLLLVTHDNWEKIASSIPPPVVPLIGLAAPFIITFIILVGVGVARIFTR